MSAKRLLHSDKSQTTRPVEGHFSGHRSCIALLESPEPPLAALKIALVLGQLAVHCCKRSVISEAFFRDSAEDRAFLHWTMMSGSAPSFSARVRSSLASVMSGDDKEPSYFSRAPVLGRVLRAANLSKSQRARARDGTLPLVRLGSLSLRSREQDVE